MITQKEFDALRAKIHEAWGDDITPEMEASLNCGEYRLIDNMRRSVLESLNPTKIVEMIDAGESNELRALAEQCEARMDLIDEVTQIKHAHAN